MKQNGYLFTAGVTVSQMRPGPRGGKTLQTWDTCSTAIVYGGDTDRAQKTFENWCQAPGHGDDPAQTEIKKIVGAELIDQLLTEAGGEELDWPAISQRMMESIPAAETEADAPAAADDPGYWVDANQVVPPEFGRLDIELLKRELPDDIGSALNWSPQQKVHLSREQPQRATDWS